MKRSWAADRGHLTAALESLAQDATDSDSRDIIPLLPPPKRSPLWLLIFPEGTINSDEERVKSAKYAERENIVCRHEIKLIPGRLCLDTAP